MEHPQEHIPEVIFTEPSLEQDVGEVLRVAEAFTSSEEEKELFLKNYYEAFEKGQAMTLYDAVWAELKNTDSFDIKKGDWESVAHHTEQAGRDWEKIRDDMQSGQDVAMPTILKINGIYHKVGGNTRLMVARALGIEPTVFMIDMSK